ncbi:MULTISPECIES: YggS family pyridoxal phosphate-dependent enzyme [unclassified Marinobacterium]|uniref:YggS family pyridoxal phosphate-dependent enzyme n=1 Tax=unclassified Marinobacterium TaxID=2644139 RepID=UPI001567EB67|nr:MULTISPECIES: YggS family pyridoxal phosphate-dependent enzyme [unclassified Marinobacterium]
MTSIAESLKKVRSEIEKACAESNRSEKEVCLLAVSKTRSVDEVSELARLGQRAFGENYLQEALDKISALEPLNLEWHFIGPIQSNKTKPIAEQFAWVHSVDRLKIAQRLSAQRPYYAEDLNICLQVNISCEESKSGCLPDEALELAKQIAELPKINLRGLMAIPEATEDVELQKKRFCQVRTLFEEIKQAIPSLDTLSMGMSGDLDAAIEEGATIVRIGTALFGPRNYNK